jgi:hypothetical protein
MKEKPTALDAIHTFEKTISLVHRYTQAEEVAARMLATWNAMDINQDAVLTEEEALSEWAFATAASLLAGFRAADTNEDNALNFEEAQGIDPFLTPERFEFLQGYPLTDGLVNREQLQKILFWVLEEKMPAQRSGTLDADELRQTAAMFPPRVRSIREYDYKHNRISIHGQHEKDSHTANLNLASPAGLEALRKIILGTDPHGIDNLTHNYIRLLQEEIAAIHSHERLRDIIGEEEAKNFIHEAVNHVGEHLIAKDHVHMRDKLVLTVREH